MMEFEGTDAVGVESMVACVRLASSKTDSESRCLRRRRGLRRSPLWTSWTTRLRDLWL